MGSILIRFKDTDDGTETFFMTDAPIEEVTLVYDKMKEAGRDFHTDL
jgi:hypothetical protein